MKNGVPFALLFTRVASDAQLLLLKKHYGTFCKEYGNIGFDYLKVFLSISNTYMGFIICLRVLLINLLSMPINWYRLIFGWDLPHLGIRMWQCGWWCYRKGIFSCFLFNLLEFYSNAAITMIISSQFTRNTQRKENSSSSASLIHCGLISIKKWHFIIGTYYFSILENHKVQAWIFGHQSWRI